MPQLEFDHRWDHVGHVSDSVREARQVLAEARMAPVRKALEADGPDAAFIVWFSDVTPRLTWSQKTMVIKVPTLLERALGLLSQEVQVVPGEGVYAIIPGDRPRKGKFLLPLKHSHP